MIKFVGNVHAMRSDLLKGQVVVSFAIPLTEETMELRQQLAVLKVMDDAVAVTIEPIKPAANKNQMTLPLPDDSTITMIAALSNGETKSVTLTGAQFDAIADSKVIYYPMRDE